MKEIENAIKLVKEKIGMVDIHLTDMRDMKVLDKVKLEDFEKSICNIFLRLSNKAVKKSMFIIGLTEVRSGRKVISDEARDKLLLEQESDNKFIYVTTLGQVYLSILLGFVTFKSDGSINIPLKGRKPLKKTKNKLASKKETSLQYHRRKEREYQEILDKSYQ